MSEHRRELSRLENPRRLPSPADRQPPTAADLCCRPWRDAFSPAPVSLSPTVPSYLPRSPAYFPAARPLRRVANRRTRAKKRRRRRLSWWRRQPRIAGRMRRSGGMGRKRTTRTPASPGGAGGRTSRGSLRPSSLRWTSTSNTAGSLSRVRLLQFSCCSILSLSIMILPSDAFYVL